MKADALLLGGFLVHFASASSSAKETRQPHHVASKIATSASKSYSAAASMLSPSAKKIPTAVAKKRGAATMSVDDFDKLAGKNPKGPMPRYLVPKYDQENYAYGLAASTGQDKKYSGWQPHMKKKHAKSIVVTPYPGDENDLVDKREDGKVRRWLAETAKEFKEVAEKIDNLSKCGVFVYLELTMNISCASGMHETMCSKDHKWEDLSHIAFAEAKAIPIVRVTAPAYTISELQKFAIMPAADVDEEGDQAWTWQEWALSYPRLLYMRRGTGPNKSWGRLYTLFDMYGKKLFHSETRDLLKDFFRTRDRSGLCAMDDNPAIAVNGCR